MNYPPTIEDYATFENNYDTIKLCVLKLGDEERDLLFYYSDATKNNRILKIALILLENNHYIFVTKFKTITKFIRNTKEFFPDI